MSVADIPILDTHQHLIDRTQLHYSWTDSLPKLAGQFGYAEYTAAAAGTGILRTAFMETAPDEWQAEPKMIYQLASKPGSLIRSVIAGCRLEEESAGEHLDAISHPLLIGIRRICHVEPDGFSEQPQFVANVRGLAARGLTFDLCFLARQLPYAQRLARACPDVQFILDHCGVPDIAGGALDPWREDLEKLSRLPNVACKISGLLAYCRPDNANLEAVKPYVRHAIDCFGPQRLVWGSDWPLVTLNSDLPSWVRITRQLIADLSPDEQRGILYDNAVRIYRMDRRADPAPR